MNLNTFWRQPIQGFNDENNGRTEAQIQSREAKIGFKLPDLYRELMKIQNGGLPRKRGFFYRHEYQDLIFNGAVIAPILPEKTYYSTFSDVLKEVMVDEKITALSDTPYCYPDRLPVISRMDGHATMCFDYGWKQKTQLEHPEIVFFNDDFKEYLRVKSFDEFVNGLVYFGYESYLYYFGIEWTHSIDHFKTLFSEKLNIEFEDKTIPRNGSPIYEKLYRGNLPIEAEEVLHFSISQNKLVANTLQFQERLSTDLIIAIGINRNKYESIHFNSKKYGKIMKDLLIGNYEDQVIEEILIPLHVEEPQK